MEVFYDWSQGSSPGYWNPGFRAIFLLTCHCIRTEDVVYGVTDTEPGGSSGTRKRERKKTRYGGEKCVTWPYSSIAEWQRGTGSLPPWEVQKLWPVQGNVCLCLSFSILATSRWVDFNSLALLAGEFWFMHSRCRRKTHYQGKKALDEYNLQELRIALK